MLKFSKKADYALMALQHIAAVQLGDVTKARIVNTKEIAEEHHIPVELLAKVLQTLARHARLITIAQVLEAIEGPLGITECYHVKGGSSCEQHDRCNIRTPLLKIQDSISQLLNSMTVEDMMGGSPLITVQSLSAEGVER